MIGYLRTTDNRVEKTLRQPHLSSAGASVFACGAAHTYDVTPPAGS